MTHNNETDAERDRRVSANLTSQLANKTVAKITLVDVSCRADDDCHDRIIIEFTDGTLFTLDEIGQAGGMRYELSKK